MKVMSIVGARPEFIQAAPVSQALRREHVEVLVHTGQHYDYQMSQVFFQDLAIPQPDYNLGVGSGSHGRQTAEMLVGLEELMLKERPDWVIVRGDTNSTIAGALAAAKLGIPLAHVESGARSFDRSMPEELNRVLTDHVSDLLFCVAPSGVDNLAAEGLTKGVHYVGDVMYDAVLQYLPVAQASSRIGERLGLVAKSYYLATVHRAANADDPERLGRIVEGLNRIEGTVVFPVHPRTRKRLEQFGLSFRAHVRPIEPIGYLDMLALEAGARKILTDSGGVTREAYFVGVPCITLRAETEHVETVEHGWNVLVDAEPSGIVAAARTFEPSGAQPKVYGDGTAAEKIVSVLSRHGINESNPTSSTAQG